MAADLGNNWFMGTELGGMNIKMKASATLGGTTESLTDTMNATYESLKIGKYFDNSRVFILPLKFNAKNDPRRCFVYIRMKLHSQKQSILNASIDLIILFYP
jgi:hypothetical protein